VLESGEAILVREVATSDLLRPVRDAMRDAGTTSIAAVPLRLAEATAILRISSRDRGFTPADLDTLREAAILIERIARGAAADDRDRDTWIELALKIADAVLEVALDGRIVAVHRGGSASLDADMAGVAGKLLPKVLFSDRSPGVGRELVELLNGSAPRSGHRLMVETEGGSRSPVRAFGSGYRGPLPRALVALCAEPDAASVSDRLIDDIPVPLLTIDRTSTTVTGANPAAEKLFTTTAEALIGRPLAELVGAEEDRIVRPDGRSVAVRVLRTGAGGSSDSVIAAILDQRSGSDRDTAMRSTLEHQIDQLARLHERVEELASRRTLFLSASAHELKTPLTILLVYLETLLDDLAEGMSEEQLQFLRICHESVLRLRRLVLDLIDLAALEAGKIRLDIGRVELEPALAAVVEEMQPLARRAGVRLEAATPAELPAVRADEGRVQQVIRNLVDNAIKNTAADGSVTIGAAGEDDSVVVTVADTGVGIPQERLASIFEEFVQLDPESESDGSGLGLAVCRRLVSATGGRIEVTSQEGKGSAFSVHLPRWPE
jgi:signal transduction histidine kinase